MAKVAIHAGGAKAEREGHNPRDCDGSGQQHPGNAHGPRQLRRARTEADGTGQLQRPCDRYGERQRRFLWTERELWLENLMEEQERAKEKGSGEDRTALLRLPGEMAKLHQDPMLFSNDIFFIEPKVELINLRAIDAPFTYIPSTANMGFCFKFAPEEGIVAPGDRGL
ncbi:uncharacterized protein GJ701_016090 isoform 3-T7 [Geothlypis trichas]